MVTLYRCHISYHLSLFSEPGKHPSIHGLFHLPSLHPHSLLFHASFYIPNQCQRKCFTRWGGNNIKKISLPEMKVRGWRGGDQSLINANSGITCKLLSAGGLGLLEQKNAAIFFLFFFFYKDSTSIFKQLLRSVGVVPVRLLWKKSDLRPENKTDCLS